MARFGFGRGKDQQQRSNPGAHSDDVSGSQPPPSGGGSDPGGSSGQDAGEESRSPWSPPGASPDDSWTEPGQGAWEPRTDEPAPIHEEREHGLEGSQTPEQDVAH